MEKSGEIWSSTPPDGPLHDVPFAVKDLYHQQNTSTRAGTVLPAPLRKRVGSLVATLRALGSLPVGKTHLHEMAYGLTGENPHFGDVSHPHHPDRTTGGSSSGSAAVVVTGVVLFALGTDTAGSLRVPAAYCGLYAWRDVPGQKWIRDAIPLARKFDTAGWLAGSTQDMITLHRALFGALPKPTSNLRGAFMPAESLGVAMDVEARAATETMAEHFTSEAVSYDHDLPTHCRGVGKTYTVLQSTDAFVEHRGKMEIYSDKIGPDVRERYLRGQTWTAAQLDQRALHALV